MGQSKAQLVSTIDIINGKLGGIVKEIDREEAMLMIEGETLPTIKASCKKHRNRLTALRIVL